MNSFVEMFNLWGEKFARFAWTMLWQSSLVIAGVLLLDLILHRKVRASVRYALWLIVLVKLLLPTSLASPTSPAWWLRPSKPVVPAPAITSVRITAGTMTMPAPAGSAPLVVPSAPPQPSFTAWLLAFACCISIGLWAWMLSRWRDVSRMLREAVSTSGQLEALLESAQHQARCFRPMRLRLTPLAMSPAVCGLFRPVIVLSQNLVTQLTRPQLRAVLLHELFHLRRGDIWVNCAQTLIQIFYWWHPLVWIANARIRQLREQAVDDAVMLALREESETYAPTLLEVARLALRRPLASLGLVGILESRSALRQRIERLINFKTPIRSGLSLSSALGLLTFSALAVPLGQAPSTSPALDSSQPLAQETPGLISAKDRQQNASDSLREARNLFERGFERGRLDEAESRFKRMLELDPADAGAKYYLNLIKNERSRHSTNQAFDNAGKFNVSKDSRSAQPPMINLKVKFVELPEAEILASGVLRAYIQTILGQSGPEGWRTNVASAQDNTTIVGLSDPQSRIAREQLELRGAHLLNEASVTTLSGHQTQIQLVQPQPQNTVTTNKSAHLDAGAILDIVPYTSEDGHTIQVTLTPTIPEFIEYDDPGAFVPRPADVVDRVNTSSVGTTETLPSNQPRQASTAGPSPVAVQSLPHYRLHPSVPTSVTVWDGNTLVMSAENTQTSFTNEIPVLGDLPLVGRLFRPHSHSGTNRNLLIFVTVTIIDPAGNRLHPDNSTK